jgi:hypothetical protein
MAIRTMHLEYSHLIAVPLFPMFMIQPLHNPWGKMFVLDSIAVRCGQKKPWYNLNAELDHRHDVLTIFGR